ncbi:MAG: thiol reductant ABC exporter subunit CydC [Acidimicrobiia bacterium]
MTRAQVARRLLRLLRPLAPLMTVSASARVINQGLGVAIPAIAAGMVVGFAADAPLKGFVALLAGLALIKGTFRYIEQFTGHGVAFRLLAELRTDTFRKIVPLAPAGLEDDRTGDLVARVIGDIDRVEPFYAHTIAPLASAIAVPALAALSLAVWIDPVLALVFVPFPLLIALMSPWIKARRVAELSREARTQAGETAAVFTDSVQGAREVAIFGARDIVSSRIEDRSRAVAFTRRSLSRISGARFGLNDLLAGGAIVTMLAVASGRLDAGLIDISGLAAAVVVSWVGTAPARALEDIVPDLEQALAAAGRLFELADREPPVAPSVGDGAPGHGAVRYEDVHVRFARAGSPALAGIDFEIPDRGYVAIVGPSGSGKSTMVELLVRFRDPDSGRVLLGGVNVKNIEEALLRESVTYVPQRSEIFFGTLAENLMLSRPEASDQELWEALDRAQLGTWARSLEAGLETPVGELGGTLSGGQRQRLAIARAFLRDPRVLVLDEATSELDAPTERLLLDQIALERGKRTVIVVAHRLESIVDADEILVIDRGHLVEKGTHESLTAAGGVYSALWQRHLDFIGRT